MIPYIENKALENFVIKDFSGGVNYVLDKTRVNDNQLTEVNNMWFKDGALRTRPAMKMQVGGRENDEKSELSVNEINSVVIDNKRYFLETVTEGAEIKFRLVSFSDAMDLGSVKLEKESENVISVIFKEDIYIFTGGVNKIFIIERASGGQYNPPRQIEDFEIYSPLILTNCWSCHNDSGKINAMLARGAVQFENFNMLSDRYRMEFSQYDTQNYVEVEEGNVNSRVSYMEYGLPYTTSSCKGNIVLEYIDRFGAFHKHIVDCPKENAPEVEDESSKINSGDDLYLHAFIKGDVCHVTLNTFKEAENCEPDYISITEYVNNNLTVNAPRPYKKWDKVALMSEAVWYGNNALGINGGSRLFLGGHKNEKSLLVWSDFESPLYFPESNYAYVGDKGQKITALAKQGASLIIFKEKEIYSTQYVVGETDASKKDITLGNAYFPLTLIHPSIGCISAGSIQLLRNRLVFMSSIGNICTLSEQNQYSESNVYNVSQMVAPKLKNTDKVVSADWNGFYLLFAGNQVFLMDYNTYGYVNIRSSDKESTANMRIPWYVWSLPKEINAVVNNDGNLLMWAKTSEKLFDVMSFADEVEDCFFDEVNGIRKEMQKEISYFAQTKHFDFGVPYRYKILEKVYVEGIKSNKLTVSFITDGPMTEEKEGFFNCLIPERRIVKTLGIGLRGTGRFALYAINMRFRAGDLIR